MKKGEMSVTRLVAVLIIVMLLIVLVMGPGGALKDAVNNVLKSLKILTPKDDGEYVPVDIDELSCSGLSAFFKDETAFAQTPENLVAAYGRYINQENLCSDKLSANILFAITDAYFKGDILKTDTAKRFNELAGLFEKLPRNIDQTYLVGLYFKRLGELGFYEGGSGGYTFLYRSALSNFAQVSRDKNSKYYADANFQLAESNIKFEYDNNDELIFLKRPLNINDFKDASLELVANQRYAAVEMALQKIKDYSGLEGIKSYIAESNKYIEMLNLVLSKDKIDLITAYNQAGPNDKQHILEALLFQYSKQFKEEDTGSISASYGEFNNFIQQINPFALTYDTSDYIFGSILESHYRVFIKINLPLAKTNYEALELKMLEEIGIITKAEIMPRYKGYLERRFKNNPFIYLGSSYLDQFIQTDLALYSESLEYERTNDPEAAFIGYKEIISNYPNSLVYNNALERYKIIAPKFIFLKVNREYSQRLSVTMPDGSSGALDKAITIFGEMVDKGEYRANRENGQKLQLEYKDKLKDLLSELEPTNEDIKVGVSFNTKENLDLKKKLDDAGKELGGCGDWFKSSFLGSSFENEICVKSFYDLNTGCQVNGISYLASCVPAPRNHKV